MAADVVLEPDSANPCCAKLKEKYLTVKSDKNKIKQYLKQAMAAFNAVEEKIQQVEKALIQEKEKIKELEKENHDLKAEVSSYQKNGLTNGDDDEKLLLRAHISESEDKIRSLEELLLKEKKKSDSEARKAESEKKKAAEEKHLLHARISESQDERKSLEELLQKEKKKSDAEAKKAASEKKKAAEAWKLVKMEKNKAEEERKLAEIERKKAEEQRVCMEKSKEKNFAEEQKKLAEIERKISEQYRICLEKTKAEVREAREKMHAELSKTDEARKRVEVEKQKASMEKARADSRTMKVVELERLLEVEKKRAVNESIRADRLSQMLEGEKQTNKELQMKIEEISSVLQRQYGSCNREERHGGNLGVIRANMKLLKQQLKLEKKKVKYAKRVAKLEKVERSYMIQEFHTLKHGFKQLFSRFNVLGDRLSCSIEGTDAVAKVGKPSDFHRFKLKNDLVDSKKGKQYSGIDCELTQLGIFDFTEPLRENAGLPLPRGSSTRPTTGIISELESPIGFSDRNKSQSSAICSNTSYSDERSLGSQERGSMTVTASAKLAKKHSNKRPTIMKPSNEVAKIRSTRLAIVETDVKKTCDSREVGNASLPASMYEENEVINGKGERNSKRRKVQDVTEPVARVYTENKQSHLELGGKSCASKDVLITEDVVNMPNLFQSFEISQNLHDRIVSFKNGHKKTSKQVSNHNSNTIASRQQTSVLQALGQDDNQKQCVKFAGKGNSDPSSVVEASPSQHQLRKNICVEQEGIHFNNEQTELISFEKMINGNCLKILDLDDDAEEDRYRMAIEMPLSPTLPDFEIPDLRLCVENDVESVERYNAVSSHPVDNMRRDTTTSSATWNLPSPECKNSHHSTKDSAKTCVIEIQCCVSQHDEPDGIEDNPSCSKYHGSDQTSSPGTSTDSKIDTVMAPFLRGSKAFPNLGCHRGSESDIIDKPQLVSDLGNLACLYKIQDDGSLLRSTGKMDNFKINVSSVVSRENQAGQRADRTTSGLVEEQITSKVEVPNGAIIYSPEKQVLSSELTRFTKADTSKGDALCSGHNLPHTDSVAEVEGTAGCHVLFLKTKDKDSISRILQLRNTFSHQDLMVAQVDHLVLEAHSALAVNAVLLPEEKGSLFFSLLLCNVSSRMSANSKSTVGEHLVACIQPFATELSNVLSNGETKLLVDEICPLDVLAGLIEDFLIERKVVMCDDIACELKNSSSDPFQLDGSCEFSRAATSVQFVAGCTILASISATADQIGFLLEASYKILLLCRNDSSWILVALHVFASICEKDFFNDSDHGFLVIALRSVVLLLERGYQSPSFISPCHHTRFDTEPTFPPCDECPFALGAVCVDKLINLLLDVLQSYVPTAIGCADINGSVELSVCMIPPSTEQDEESRHNKIELDGRITPSLASCCLFTFRKRAAGLPDYFPERAFCCFNDIISLVELVGSHMSWAWTYDKIIPRLLQLVESCKNEEYSAAFFVLLGQLGRFGIDTGGRQKEGIAELRCSIHRFIDNTIVRKMGLSTQLAAIGALLNLLPLSFREIVGERAELIMDTSQSGHAKLIKKWFSDLSHQQQSLALDLFE